MRATLSLSLLAGISLTLAGCAGVGYEPADVAVPKPPTVSPAEWNSEPAPFPDDFLHEPQVVLIHHSGVTWQEGTNPYTQIKNLQSWGKRDRGWSDVPYHFLIAPNGQIFEGRALQYRPDTNTDFDTSGYINVELRGSFGVQRVSEPQLRSAALISAWLVSEFGMDPDEIVGHMDVAQTACPGADLYRYLHDGPFNNWVKAALRGEEPKVALLPPLPDGPHEMIPDVDTVWVPE